MDDKLVKLLNLTTSPNDSEALLAVRKANDHIKAAGKTWEQVLSPPAMPKRQRDDPMSDAVHDMFKYCLDHLKPSIQRRSIERLKEKMQRSGGLSADDLNTLKTWYGAIREAVARGEG